MAKDDDILDEARDLFRQCEEREADNRDEALDDLEFARLARQWRPEDEEQRAAEGRPCLTINRMQASKVYAVRDSANSEILFYYCSASSVEIDRCVVWNYKANYWNIGRAPRLCGTDRGVLTYPIFVDAQGAIHEHEVGLSYDGAAPFAEGGPIEIGNGDQVMRCQRLIPDEKTVGDVTATFLVRFCPERRRAGVRPLTCRFPDIHPS